MPTSPRAFRAELGRRLADIHWRHWGALGVASQVESEATWLVDPEALAASTFSPAIRDRRLREAARAWLSLNRDWLNRSRLGRVEREFADAGLATALPQPDAMTRRKVTRPEVRQPVLGRLALRALLGVDARADVYLYLWNHVEGNSNSIARAVRCDQKSAYRILEKWAAAGIVRRVAGGWTLAPRWRALLPEAPGVRYLDWVMGFRTLDRVAVGLAGAAGEDAYLASSLFRDLWSDLSAICRVAGTDLPEPGPNPGARYFAPGSTAVLELTRALGAGQPLSRSGA